MSPPPNTHHYHKPHSFAAVGYLWIISLCLASTFAQDTSPALTLFFPENKPAPTVIGNIATQSVAGGLLTLLNGDDLTANGKPLKEIFSLDTNGQLVALRTLDREVQSHYTFLTLDLAYGHSASVLLNILDENDNAPRWENPRKNINVSENTQPGDQLALLGSAIDNDNGINSTQRYELISGSAGEFRIEETQVWRPRSAVTDQDPNC